MGIKKYIETPEKLWEHFISYVEWAKSNPRLKEDYVGKDAMRVMRELERPLTWVGFECYLNENAIISELKDYEQNREERYTEFVPIVEQIKKAIQTDQLEGGAVGMYNNSIISRLLGLADTQNINLGNKPDWLGEIPIKE
jgi:DNA-packaging protein gp3